ncbi:MAG: hypothetical protein K2N91_04725 [Muribaculaceae bacterium]|nr:hypothetical protein [Muribaculaceae bacterium]
MNRLPAYSYDGIPRQGGCTALQPYSLVKDYQGNVRQVVNERGAWRRSRTTTPTGCCSARAT